MSYYYQKGFLHTVIAGAAGALLTVAVIIAWASNNPSQLARWLGTSEENTRLGATQTSGEAPPLNTAQESLVVDVVKRTNPAVVSIVLTADVPVIERYYSPFDDFFGIPQFRQRGTEKQEVGGGSGFLVSADGMVVTNRHVVSEENVEYTVFTNDGTKYPAKVVARDPVNDIALLKISGGSFPFLELGASDSISVGQTVIAIGNALGEFQNTVSVGVVSGLSRSITAGDTLGRSEQLEGVIQTDAAINPGNSGGPLLDLNGKVIGVNVAIAPGSQNVGFALPSTIVKSVVESVQKTGWIVRPFLGVRYTLITPALKQENRLPVDYGALVTRGDTRSELAVTPGSPAEVAGIEEGDIILEVDGKKIEGTRTLSSVIAQKNVGDRARLKVLHKGVTKEVEVTLQEIPQ